MRTPLAVLLIIVGLIIGGVGGYYLGQQVGQETPALVVETAAPLIVNPFEAQQVNPLEGAGYENPIEEVKFNPFE